MSYRRNNFLLFGLLFFFAFLVSCWGIEVPGYWTDEGASISASEKSVFSLIEMAKQADIVHTFYYFILKIWISCFGIGEFATRSLSAVAVAITSLVILWIAKELEIKGALIAALIYPLLPISLWMSAETRSYAMSALLFAIALALFARWNNSHRNSEFILFSVAAIISIYMFMFSCLGIILFPLLCRRNFVGNRGFTKKFISSYLAIFVVAAPLIFMAQMQSRQVAWIPSITFSSFIKSFIFNQYFGGIHLLGWLFFLLVTLLFLPFKGSYKETLRCFLAFVFIPSLILGISGVVLSHSLYQVRYISFATPVVALIMGGGTYHFSYVLVNLFQVKTKNNIKVLLSILLLITVCGSSLYYGAQTRGNVDSKSSWKSVSKYLQAHVHEGDGLVMFSPHMLAMQDAYPTVFRETVLVNKVQSTRWPHMDTIFSLKGGTLSASNHNVQDCDSVWYVSDSYSRRTKDGTGTVISDVGRDLALLRQEGFDESERVSLGDSKDVIVVHLKRK